MAAKKMFPPHDAGGPIDKGYDEVKLRIGIRIQDGQIVMQFSDHVEWVRMSGSGARKLAAVLIEKADELDRHGGPAPISKPPSASV
jgi:hypothetical protein